MSQQPIFTLGLILLTASLVAMLSRRFRLPYTVGLVAAGIGLGVLRVGFDPQLGSELIFYVLLPPLIFEAALQLRWKPFARELPSTLLLSFVGVALAAAILTLGARLLIGWTWLSAALFGTLIAATDPVSVIAAFKEMRVDRRLSLLVESESLLNDGAAAVGFQLLSGLRGGETLSPEAVGGTLLWTIAGGIAIGALVASLLLLIAWRTNDHLVEITLTMIAAYGSFLFAQNFGASGVLATLTAGLIVGNLGQRAISTTGRPHVVSFWEYAAFLANSIVFIQIGAYESWQAFRPASAVFIAIALVLLSRALTVYPLSAVLHRTRFQIPFAQQHVLFWGGLRGALALALALALPADLANRREIIVVTFAVVAFSIFVQGLTMPMLVKRLSKPDSSALNPEAAEN